MWYFTWVLGVGLAAAAGILNAMWLEYQLTGTPEENSVNEVRPDSTL